MRNCAKCASAFTPRRASHRYCSRACSWSCNGKGQPRTGSRRKNAKGYIEVIVWIDGKKKIFKEHRLIAEAAIGRALLRSEDVHHINGVKDDNRPENLEIIDHGRHTAVHTNKERTYRRGYRLKLSNAERAARSARMKAMRSSELIKYIDGEK